MRTADEDVSYAQQVQTEWIAAGRPVLGPGPYEIVVISEQARSSTHFRKDGELNATGLRAPYPGKPDLDNIVKLALDSLVAVGALPDDRHLVKLTARKAWCRSSEQQGLRVSAFCVGPAAA